MPFKLTHKPLNSLIPTSEYGTRVPSSSRSGVHQGIDLRTSAQTGVEQDVYAAHGEEIIKAGLADGFGWTVVVQNYTVSNNGIAIYGNATLYAHLSQMEFNNIYAGIDGALVKGGDKIGVTGRSNYNKRTDTITTAPPHLHFEILGLAAANEIRDNSQ